MTNYTKQIITLATFLMAGLLMSTSAFAYDRHESCDQNHDHSVHDNRGRYDTASDRDRYDDTRTNDRRSDRRSDRTRSNDRRSERTTTTTTNRRRGATTTTTTTTRVTNKRRHNARRNARPVVSTREVIEWVRGRRYVATYTTTRFHTGRTRTKIGRASCRERV